MHWKDEANIRENIERVAGDWELKKKHLKNLLVFPIKLLFCEWKSSLIRTGSTHPQISLKIIVKFFTCFTLFLSHFFFEKKRKKKKEAEMQTFIFWFSMTVNRETGGIHPIFVFFVKKKNKEKFRKNRRERTRWCGSATVGRSLSIFIVNFAGQQQCQRANSRQQKPPSRSSGKPTGKISASKRLEFPSNYYQVAKAIFFLASFILPLKWPL